MTAANPPIPARPALPPRLHNRLIGLLVLAIGLGLLGVAIFLEPDPQGINTNARLGMTPCGFRMQTGLPCATCGMTTSFTYVVRGQYTQALIIQPAGALLALLAAMGVWIGAWSAVSGMSLQPMGRIFFRPRALLIAAALVLIAWGYTTIQALLGHM